MTMVIKGIAIGTIILSMISIIAYPAFFGKSRGNFDFRGWIGILAQSIITIVLAGSVLGWW